MYGTGVKITGIVV